MPVYRRQAGTNWIVEFVHKGQRYRKSSGTTNRRKALELERRWRGEVYDQVALGKAPSLQLEAALNRYWETIIVPKGKARSAKNTLYVLDRIRGHFGEDTALEVITTEKVVAWADRLLATGLSPLTVNRYLAVLQAVLNVAHRNWQALATVPYIPRKKGKPIETRYLSETEEQKLLAASPPHLAILIVFLLGTGVRLREATHLVWSEVDLDRRPRALVHLAATRTKSGKSRGVPLPEHVRDLLVTLKAAAPKGERRVFLCPKSGRGKLLPYDDPGTAFTTARAKVGLTDVRIHDLRHTYASRLVQRGVSLYVVQQLLGHSTPSLTQRYASLAPDNLERAVGVLDAIDLPAAA